MKVDIFFSKLHQDAIIPTKRREDAGYDVYANLQEPYIRLEPQQTALLATGIASACPEGYFFYFAERGSTGSKGIGQRCGVIDSGYRGEWFICLTNHNCTPLYFVKPEYEAEIAEQAAKEKAIVYPANRAICQALVLPVPDTHVSEIPFEELKEISSERRDNKLGSSNK